MVLLTSSDFDGFPKPGPSFNPQKFKSQQNYHRYSNLEATAKAAADSRKEKGTQDKPAPGTGIAKETDDGLRKSLLKIIDHDKKKRAAVVTIGLTDGKHLEVKAEEAPRQMDSSFAEVLKTQQTQSAITISTASSSTDKSHSTSRTTMRSAAAVLNAWDKPPKVSDTTHNEPHQNGSPTQPSQPAAEAHSIGVTKSCALNIRKDDPETLRLVSIRKVKGVHETKVENRWVTLAEIDGWVCLVPHRSFKSGDLVLYFQIDSFIPASDERFGKQQPLITLAGILGHRVKTRRLGSGTEGVTVQGLAYPVEKFPEVYTQVRIVRESMKTVNTSDTQIDSIIFALYRKENWAEKLGILKWSETKQAINNAQQQQVKLGKIPTRLFPKTDIHRLEDCPNLFISEKYKALEYQESVKMDGASMTIYFLHKDSRLFRELNAIPTTTKAGPHMELENGRFGVCSKNWELHELNKSDAMGYWETALRLDLPAKMARAGHSIAIQGELCGLNINKNRERIPGTQPEFFVFAMYHMETRGFIHPRKVVLRATELGLKHVPVLGYVRIREIVADREGLKKRARQQKGEGLVYKCTQDGRSFKVISSTYLLEHNL